MSKKSKKRQPYNSKPKTPSEADAQELAKHAAGRVQDVIEKMRKPPEPVLVQLQRIGVRMRVMELDIAGELRRYVVIDAEELIERESNYIASGGILHPDQPVNVEPIQHIYVNNGGGQ